MTALNEGSERVSEPVLRADERMDTDPRSLGEIVNDVWSKAETLIRQELQLGVTDAEERAHKLKTELEQRVTQLRVEWTAKALGGAVLFTGLLAVVAAIILLLAQAVAPWLSALIVGVMVGGGGFALLKRKPAEPTPIHAHELIPRRAVENTKRDVKAIEEAIK